MNFLSTVFTLSMISFIWAKSLEYYREFIPKKNVYDTIADVVRKYPGCISNHWWVKGGGEDRWANLDSGTYHAYDTPSNQIALLSFVMFLYKNFHFTNSVLNDIPVELIHTFCCDRKKVSGVDNWDPNDKIETMTVTDGLTAFNSTETIIQWFIHDPMILVSREELFTLFLMKLRGVMYTSLMSEALFLSNYPWGTLTKSRFQDYADYKLFCNFLNQS